MNKVSEELAVLARRQAWGWHADSEGRPVLIAAVFSTSNEHIRKMRSRGRRMRGMLNGSCTSRPDLCVLLSGDKLGHEQSSTGTQPVRQITALCETKIRAAAN